jgi:hypothetical protein
VPRQEVEQVAGGGALQPGPALFRQVLRDDPQPGRSSPVMGPSRRSSLLTGNGPVESPRWHADRLYLSDRSAGEVIAAPGRPERDDCSPRWPRRPGPPILGGRRPRDLITGCGDLHPDSAAAPSPVSRH